MKKLLGIFVAFALILPLSARVHNISSKSTFGKGGKACTMGYKPHIVGDVWNVESNFGDYGDPNASSTGNPSYDWPGGFGWYYLWEGALWVGTRLGGTDYVTAADYAIGYEWGPDDINASCGWVYVGPDKSQMDIISYYNDYGPYGNNPNPIGLDVLQKSYQWSVDPYNKFIVYEMYISYNKSNSSIGGPDVLSPVFVSWKFDADNCEADATDPHLDDLVCFDGYTGNEWIGLAHAPGDTLTVLADKSVPGADGVPDWEQIYGDDPDERTLTGETYYIPRNMSYIYDGDNPSTPEDDEGEGGACAGYIFGRLIYAPPAKNDMYFTDANGDPARFPLVYSHAWWNWNNDPGTDENMYEYQSGTHSAMKGYMFMPHPFDIGAATFDYRFLLTTGPFKIANGETLKLVYVAGVGYGLDGGTDTYYKKGYVPGARQISDYAMTAYYMGSTHSDPAHPSAPDEDYHWIIPVPPAVPDLHYSVDKGIVKLVWSNIAEITPDPVDGMYDFAGYRVYRSAWNVGNWQLLAEYDTSYAPNYPHSYEDSTALPGVPYYYCVASYDKGREADTLTGRPAVKPLECARSNYMKDEKGAEVPIYITSALHSALDSVKVVPNPYYGSASWEQQYENKIAFANLPGNCKILIFTVNGDFVKEIDHTGPTGTEFWNLRSRKDLEVASGLYIYKIEQFDENGKFIDSTTGKFVIIR